MVNIAFFGEVNSFDYFHIGGVETFTRRLAVYIVNNGNKVDYILYGANKNIEISPYPGLRLKYFKTFLEAFHAIVENYNHVVTLYIFKKDRFLFNLLRKKYNHSIIFHYIFFSWPDSVIKRHLYFNEARVFPYNGKLFCISKRQYVYVSRWAKNAVYLLPPVSESYFLRTDEKPANEKIIFTFLGRIDPGKGIEEVIEIFQALKGNDRFECSIYGIHLPEHKKSLFIHNRLKRQTEIKYIEVDRKKYSPADEEITKNVFRNTDILILPYKRLSSTIDTPVTLLEAMASLCCVITKPFGNIPDIYGKSKFLIHPDSFIADAIQLLKNITYQDLIEERKRIYAQNLILNFKCGDIARRFFNALNSCNK